MCVVCGMQVGVEVRVRLGHIQSQTGTDWNKGLSGAPKSWMAAQPICAVFFARPLSFSSLMQFLYSGKESDSI